MDNKEFKNKIMEYGKIDGIVYFRNQQITNEKFLDKFIEWIESNDWEYCGTTGEYKED